MPPPAIRPKPTVGDDTPFRPALQQDASQPEGLDPTAADNAAMTGVTPACRTPACRSRVATVKAPAVESRHGYIGLTWRRAVHIRMNEVALCSGERATLLENV